MKIRCNAVVVQLAEVNLGRHQRSREFTCEYCEQYEAVLAQLVEHDLAKVGVMSSSLMYRSNFEVLSVQYIEHNLDHNRRGHELFF